MKPQLLYLVRHGAIATGGAKAFIGHTDVPLNREGVLQARAAAKWLAPVAFSRTIASDLSRTRRTCEIIAGHRACTIETMPALREIHLGDWEGASFHEIQSRFPEEFAARGRDIENWRPPHGESFADCGVRVRKTLDEIVSGPGGNVLIVGHAGVNRLILCSALGIPVKELLRIGQDYGCINVIVFGCDGACAHLVNYTPRLPLRHQDALSTETKPDYLPLECCL